jgi:thiol-disulfide isomerase/thioredoxin
MDTQKWIVAGILLFSLGFAVKNQQAVKKRSTEYDRAIASRADPCTGKKTCVVVYMAPWCPACKQVLPAVIQLLAKTKTAKSLGAKVYVGRGESPVDDEKMAREIGAGAFTDTDLTMHKKLKVGYYPAFFVMDSEGSVTLDGKDAYYWAMERAQEL